MIDEGAERPARPGWRSGQTLDKYRLTKLLGAGGMGEVYEAVHVSIGRTFAIKFLRCEYLEDERATQRFAEEARILGSLDSDYLVAVLDYGKLPDETPYLVMERLRGDNLKSLLKFAGPLSVSRAIAIALDTCRGLEIAHRAGLVHRDLKPANLFLCRRASGEEFCKVLDFGIARQLNSTTSINTNVVGTARYMAPEQVRQGNKVTPASDLYSLGAIIYECLSGHPLHDGDGVETVLFSVLHAEPRALTELAPHIPEKLAQVVHRAVAKDPQQRFQNVSELFNALLEFSAQPRPAFERGDQTSDVTSDLDASSEQGARGPNKRAPRILGVLIGALLLGTGYAVGTANQPVQAVEHAAPALVCPKVSVPTALPSVAPAASCMPVIATPLPSASSTTISQRQSARKAKEADARPSAESVFLPSPYTGIPGTGVQE